MGKSDDASGICKMFENKTSKIVCMVEKKLHTCKIAQALENPYLFASRTRGNEISSASCFASFFPMKRP